MTPQEQYLSQRLKAAEEFIMSYVDLTKSMEVYQAARYATWKQWAEEVEPPAPAQGVEEAAKLYAEQNIVRNPREYNTDFDLLTVYQESFLAGSRWQQGQANEEAFKNDPVNFLLSNAMRYLTEPQKIALRDALIERTPKAAPTIGARWVRASEFKAVGVNSPKYDDADRILILFPYDTMWRFGIASHDDGKWYYDNDYEVGQETVNQMYYLSESLATFPTREQAIGWAREDNGGGGGFSSNFMIDQMRMYDWIASKLSAPTT